MKAIGYGHSDPGKKRDHNEDSFLTDDNLGVYVLCDGVGGHNAGEVASRMAVDVIHRVLKQNARTITQYAKDPTVEARMGVLDLAEEALQEACATIYRVAESDPAKKGMSTTCDLVIVAGGNAVLAHVGDSRVYLNRLGQTHQLTEDHSFVVEQVKKGMMTVQQAMESPYAHVITRALGMHELTEVDTLHFETVAGDTLLLCSDGISDYMRGDELGYALNHNKIASAAQSMVDWANEQGGKDNSTAIIVRMEGKESAEVSAELSQKIEAMRRIPLFRHLSYHELIKVLNIAGVKHYTPGQQIVAEGDEGDELFIIVGGSVKVSKRGQHLALLERGNFFGEMQIIDNAPRSATITAVDSVKLLTLSRERLFPMLRREAALSTKLFWEFCQVLNDRLRSVNELFVGSRADLEPTLPSFPFVTADPPPPPSEG